TIEWDGPRAPPRYPPQASLYDHIRKPTARKRSVDKENGNVDDAFKAAANVIEAEYEWPFQSHAGVGLERPLVFRLDHIRGCLEGVIDVAVLLVHRTFARCGLADVVVQRRLGRVTRRCPRSIPLYG